MKCKKLKIHAEKINTQQKSCKIRIDKKRTK